MPSDRREHLLDTALSLFRTGGFHATGIDKILAKAGVAKMTLYNHFRSKDELILAALRRRDDCDHPIHAVAAEHKRLLTAYVRGLAADAGAGDADRLARQLYILIEGAIVATQVCGRTDSARDARDAAQILIAAELDQGS